MLKKRRLELPPGMLKMLKLSWILPLVLAGCATTSLPVRRAELGEPRRTADLLAVLDTPGPLAAGTVNSGDWSVPLSGLLNLDDPQAKAAGLSDRDEPIHVYFHWIVHPKYGLFVIDSGLETALRDDPDHAALRGLVASFMHVDRMKIHKPLGEFLRERGQPLAGVLLTHMHTDHVAGMPDVPENTPVYVGPGEAKEHSAQNLVVQGVVDRALVHVHEVREWPFAADADRRFAGVLDVFGDGSLWALHVPGHTPGSTAFIARTDKGPILFTGDCSHTTWGWQHGVEPGSYTGNQQQNRQSLAALRQLVQEHPAMQVRLGHQE